MKAVVAIGSIVGGSWAAWDCYHMYNFYNKDYAGPSGDFEPFLHKLRPGVIVGKPTVTNKNITVNFGPLSELHLLHAEIEKEWHWEKPQSMSLRVKKRNYEKDWQVELK